MSVRQGEQVAGLIRKLALAWNQPWTGRPAVVDGPTSRPITLRGGIAITLLSPRQQEMDRLARFWEQSSRGTARPTDVETDESPQSADETTGAELLMYVASARSDAPWREQLKRALGVVMPPQSFIFWNAPELDNAFETEESRQERREVASRARIGIVLVSPDALASDSVQEHISMLVTAAAQSQMRLTWIAVRPTDLSNTPLSRYQALGNPNRPLSELPAREATEQLRDIAKQLADAALERTDTSTRNERAKGSSGRRRAPTEGPIDVDVLAAQSFFPDGSVVNNASIAFLAEHQGKSLIVCGDASADVLAESIRALIAQRGVRRLRVDAFVVPHGGSAGNLHRELLELLDCHRYLFATNGERYGHPSRETIARILAFGRIDRSAPLTLVFNYRATTTAVWDDRELQSRWNYQTIYPQRDGGIKVQI